MLTPGLLLVDKPAGMTSHDVVAKVRKLAGTRKVGHAGTLDPMATGLLVLGLESATKLLTFIVGADKTYEATIRLGSATVTDDREGDVLSQATSEELAKVSDSDILKEIATLRGDIQQVPSQVSAIKVDGERAYAKVRAGEEVQLKARAVNIAQFQVIGAIRHSHNAIDLDVVIDCSSGTYIRALARDLGAALGVGGHLTELRRTRVGGFKVVDALELSNAQPNYLPLIPAIDAASGCLPVLEIAESDGLALRQGKRIKGHVDSPTAVTCGAVLVGVVESAGENSLKSLVIFSDEVPSV
ncbi:MAG: tRNA pseudouridine(55) synthase TruB [Micrococcales bacterium]|nr:tRNA pseudouridine(55) synthase TruB [Actinomycetota bacterium]NCA08165.1 tRNA pseudouridine(55) synthase TruB [Micrococcales bacterium]